MRRVLVTGGNRGIGLELVRQLLARGDRVVATARKPAQSQALNRLVAAHPNRLHVLPLDAAKAASVEELGRELPLVTDALDVVVANAGVLPEGERFGQVRQEDLVHAFTVNAAGVFLLAQVVAPMLERGASPRFAAISSVLGSIARTQRFGTPSYAMSKAALDMAIRQLAHELGPRGIVCLALHPGWVKTDMGGDKAPVTAKHSVCGLLTLVEGLQRRDSGRFFDYTGAAHAW